MNRLDELSERLRSALGDTLRELVVAFDEVTIVVGSWSILRPPVRCVMTARWGSSS